ncbi:MAG: hypothetical protein JWQ98_3086 [Chlorobi bacterium]|nr:hypothetical protein [Chlorobiota bacterium]
MQRRSSNFLSGGMSALLFPIAMMIAISSCTSFNPEKLRKEITSEESLWRGAALRDYSFYYRIGCLCPPEAQRPVIITVRNGSVAGAIYSDTRGPVPADLLPNYPTIDKLFNDLRDGSDGAKDMDVRFDPTYGYPRSMNIEVEDVPEGVNFFRADSVRPIR